MLRWLSKEAEAMRPRASISFSQSIISTKYDIVMTNIVNFCFLACIISEHAGTVGIIRDLICTQ